MIRNIICVLFLFGLVSLFGQQADFSSVVNSADELVLDYKIEACKAILNEAIHSGNPEVQKNEIQSRLDLITFLESVSITERDLYKKINSTLQTPLHDSILVRYINYFIEHSAEDNASDTLLLKNVSRSLEIARAQAETQTDASLKILSRILHRKGQILYEVSQYDLAQELIEEAIKVNTNRNHPDLNFKGVMMYNLANAEYYEGNEVKAFRIVQEAERILSALDHPNLDYLSSIYSELATYHASLGYLEKAENYLIKSKGLFQKFLLEAQAADRIDIHEKLLHYCYLSAFVYAYYEDDTQFELIATRAKQNIERAKEHFKQVAKSKKNRVAMAAVYNFTGEFFVDPAPIQAVGYYKLALQTLNDPSQFQYALQYKFNIAKAHFKSKNYSQSLKAINAVIEEGEKIKDTRLDYFYMIRGSSYVMLNKLDDAMHNYSIVFNRINTNQENLPLTQVHRDSLFSPNDALVDAFLVSGMGSFLQDSTETDTDAVRIAASNCFRFAIQQFKHNFHQTQYNAYILAEYEKIMSGIFHAWAWDQESLFTTTDFINFSEDFNAKYLWEKYKQNGNYSFSIDEKIQKKEQNLRATLVELKKKNLVDSDDHIAEQIFNIELELEDIEIAKSADEKLKPGYQPLDFNIIAFQSKLDAKSLVIKYEKIEDELLRYRISANDLTIESLGAYDFIKAEINTMLDLIRNPNSDIDEIHKRGESLKKYLIPESVQNYQDIIIVPDKILHHLPFELLRMNGQYLFENTLVSYTNSLALMHEKSQNNTIDKSVVFAPSYSKFTLSADALAIRGAPYNLEGALKEATSISKLLSSKKFIKEDATKNGFIETAASYDLLHLSMHSYLHDEDPELSSLVFHDAAEDYELYIGELYGMQLNASMAVLSACNTGVGREKTGEGIISMTRAFFYAGVPSIVSSLWSAPDQATSTIMIHFYEELKKGKGKDEALNAAKLNYLENQTLEAFKHPFYWAGFVVFGNTDPLIFKTQKRTFRWWGFILAALVFAYIYGQVKRKKINQL